MKPERQDLGKYGHHRRMSLTDQDDNRMVKEQKR